MEIRNWLAMTLRESCDLRIASICAELRLEGLLIRLTPVRYQSSFSHPGLRFVAPFVAVLCG